MLCDTMVISTRTKSCEPLQKGHMRQPTQASGTGFVVNTLLNPLNKLTLPLLCLPTQIPNESEDVLEKMTGHERLTSGDLPLKINRAPEGGLPEAPAIKQLPALTCIHIQGPEGPSCKQDGIRPAWAIPSCIRAVCILWMGRQAWL